MPCTTILVGKNATYDGSTIIARSEDSPGGEFDPKCVKVVLPSEQPRVYRSAISHVEIDLSDLEPVSYTSVPDAINTQGLWAASGINAHNVAMSATETISVNPRVLGADPLVELKPATGTQGEEGYTAEVPGGLGEEDFLTVVLPYCTSAREGVLRTGALLERYGTYETNGMAFSDENEVWWLETVGGHHWIARRVPDDCYVTMPNQLGIDSFDLDDAEGAQRDHLCSSDLRAWMAQHHLDLTVRRDGDDGSRFNPRYALGTTNDADHIYNTPRAWDMQRFLNPTDSRWTGPQADYSPEMDSIPWARTPEHLVTVEDVKYMLSRHFQGTELDCYGHAGTAETRGKYRPIGVNRNDEVSVLQLRPYGPSATRGVHWVSFGSNVFNAIVPLYAQVRTVPAYLAGTSKQVSTDNFYWTNRLIAALSDPHFDACTMHVERYQDKMAALAHAHVNATDRATMQAAGEQVTELLEQANEQMVRILNEETDNLLAKVLYESSLRMRNAFARSDG